ncbi:hypothetical protein FD13_GL001463 [Levilactobacillus senmaizukei DSM 21775 = NBRC 103853]|uniref:Uncharacterized protein n=1 Tax=Levilactobacillus senmaizukei DSM 21775 = NBRC 103853 TaxID=1423803 RepID=A0A0R2DFD5_9LACO|nr:hypothetical protein [Levilactobacillus senmaizukei]KRN02744.1 hypothetical protein FD13_GL001463 [Levilactobacillus senmaizukei DSM 21775 = NBRC 103853]
MKKVLKSLLMAMVFFLAVCVLGTTASAKRVGYSYSKMPKSMTGTWYTYTNYGYGKKKVYKTHINNKNLRKYKKHKIYYGTKAMKTSKYWTATQTGKIHGYRWIHIYGWQQSAGDGDYLNVHKFGKHKVLTVAGGADVSVESHYYRSKSVAKKMGNKHYPKFAYGAY